MVDNRASREEKSYQDKTFTFRLDLATKVKAFLFENKFTNYYTNKKIVEFTDKSLNKNNRSVYKMLEIGTSWFPNFIKVISKNSPNQSFDVKAINISESEIEKYQNFFKNYTELSNIDNVELIKMNAEYLDFESSTNFDIVIGGAILHHINYKKTFHDIKEWINGNSIMIFREPLAHNPIINFYRYITPFLHTDDEEPINLYDFIKISKKLNYKLEVIYQEALSPYLFPFIILSKVLKLKYIAKAIAFLDYKFSNFFLFKSLSRIATFVLTPIE